jgi:hypothetical protein
MRGFFEHRVAEFRRSDKGAVETFWLNAPLDKYELAAAKAQKCRGCAWFSKQTQEYTSLCHHMANATSRLIAPDYWCSEWRGEPSKETL